jgi:hypothetical protein
MCDENNVLLITQLVILMCDGQGRSSAVSLLYLNV